MRNELPFIGQLAETIKISGTSKSFARGDFILQQGDIEKNLYYVASGAIRVFLLSEHEEQTIRFGYTGSVINSLASYISGKPSDFYIEAIRKTTLKVISREEVLKLVYQDEAHLRGYLGLMETVIVQQMEREIDLLTLSPTERLNRVLRRSPDLFQRIPLKYIASYLRMAPETLSRIRNS
jgi:CRP-like cAMP-binding protein